jgi:ligand-binding sensor domain-containing protein
VTLLLLLALILVINLVVSEHAQPGVDRVAPTSEGALADTTPLVDTVDRQPASESIPTATAVAAHAEGTTTPSATVELGSVRPVPQGGFSFQPVTTYTVDIAQTSATLRAPDADPAHGPLFLLSGGTAEHFAPNNTTSFSAAATDYASKLAAAEGFQITDQQTSTVNGMDALLADIREQGTDQQPRFVGQLALLYRAPTQLVVMVGVAPPDRWSDRVAAEFAAVLHSVTLLPLDAGVADASSSPASATPTPTAAPRATAPPAAGAPTIPEPIWTLLSNANYVNGLTVSNRIVWTATDGGIVAWNQQNGSSSKFTSLDGLTHNAANSAADCDMEGLGVVFGTLTGLQIFSWEIGSWRALNSTNSPMAFDDVAAIFCDAANDRLIVGYLRHGLDIYDAASSTWIHVDRSDGLASGLVNAVTVVGEPPEIWAAAGFGLSVLRGEDGAISQDAITAFDITVFDAANSPLGNQPITALAAAADGSVWVAAGNALHRAAPASGAVEERTWSTVRSTTVDGENFPTNAIVGLAAAPDGTLWLGSVTAEICRFDPERNRCVAFFDAASGRETGMAPGPLTDLYLDAEGTLYYTTAGNGYSQLTGDTWQTFLLPDEPLLGNQVYDLAQDGDGVIWLATNGGVQQFIPIPAPSAAGFYDISPTQFQSFDSSVISDRVRVIEPDAEGGIWFGAEAVGRYNDERWTVYTALNGLAGTPVQAIEIDGQGRVWIGTPGGLTIATQGTLLNLTRAEGLPSDNILALLAARPPEDNTVWIGTGGGGLLRLQRNQIQVYNRENAKLPSDTITALAQDADGSLLVGTDRGLARVIDGQATQIRALGTAAISSLATGPNGIVWAGTVDQGAYYFNGLAWQQFTTADNLPASHIATVFVDANGVAWLGGDQGGLVQFYAEVP